MSKITFSALALAAALAGASPAHAATVVWNQGFGTGATGLDWQDGSSEQHMADSVTLSASTLVTGYTFYTASDLSANTGSGDFQLEIWSSETVPSAGGDAARAQPDQLLVSESIGFTSMTQVCSGCVLSPADPTDPTSPLTPQWDAYSLSFTFAPIELTAGTTYWIGLSGNGFDADVVSVLGVQDDAMAQFDGDQFSFIASGANGAYPVGDQMFQLLGSPVASAAAVPEPANLALLAAGLGLIALARRRRRD